MLRRHPARSRTSPLATLLPRVARFFSDPPVPEPMPLSPDCWYLLEHGFGGPSYAFRCAPEHVPLALELIVDEERSLLQARPRTESCLLLGRFDKDETLVLLALWRLYDDETSTGSQEAVIVTVDQLWAALKVYFDKISTPEKSQIEACLARIRRHRRILRLQPLVVGLLR